MSRRNLRPVTESIRAMAPVAARNSGRRAVGAKTVDIPVPGVGRWIKQLKEYAAGDPGSQGFMLSGGRVSNISMLADSVGITLKFDHGDNRGTYWVPHDDITRNLGRDGSPAQLFTIADGVKMQGELELPDVFMAQGKICVSFKTPLEYRVDLSKAVSRWLWAIPTITLTCPSIIVDEQGADPVFSGWTGALSRRLVKPHLIWSMSKALSLAMPLPLVQTRAGRRTRTRREERAVAAHAEYRELCWREGRAMTPDAAAEFIRERSCGTGVLAMAFWIAIRQFVWAMIMASIENFNAETGPGCNGE